MKITNFPKKILSSLFSIPCLFSFSQQKLGIFDGHGDIGIDVKPGSATYIPETGQYIISGAGTNGF